MADDEAAKKNSQSAPDVQAASGEDDLEKLAGSGAGANKEVTTVEPERKRSQTTSQILLPILNRRRRSLSMIICRCPTRTLKRRQRARYHRWCLVPAVAQP